MKRTLTYVFGLYFLVSQSLAAYYWFQDAKAHDFRPRYTFMMSLLVGEAKGVAWPYFAFFHEQSGKKDINRSIENFFKGYGYISKASYVEGNSKKVIEQELSLMNEGKKTLSMCNFVLLNEIYPEWGDMVKNIYIPSIDMLISCSQKADIRNLEKVKAAVGKIEAFNSWVDQNWAGLVAELEKYGYKIKKQINQNGMQPNAAQA